LSQHSVLPVVTILLLPNGNTVVQKKMGHCIIAYFCMGIDLYASAPVAKICSEYKT
jgi:hypothetical protein